MGRPRKDGTPSGIRLKAISDRKKALLLEIAELDNRLAAAIDGQVNDFLEVLRPVVKEFLLANPTEEPIKKKHIPDDLKRALEACLSSGP
jgi:hypothetical protein